MGKLSKVTFSDVLSTLAVALSMLVPAALSVYSGFLMVAQWVILVVGGFLFVFTPFLFICWMKKKSPDDIPSLKKSVDQATEIWGLWWTGENQYKLLKKPEYRAKYKRILLVDFKSNDTFYKLITTSVGTKKSQREQCKAITQIKKITKLALESGIDVKWYSGMQVYSMTLYNPKDLRINIVRLDLQQESENKNRKCHWYRAWEKNEVDEVNKHMSDFEQLWQSKRARVPTAEECS